MSFPYQRSGRFKLETEHPDLQSEHPGVFDTEVDCAGNPSTNPSTCSKYINKQIIIY